MPPDDAGPAAIARQLRALAIEIEAIGVALAGDPALAARHCRLLQSIDLIAQRQQAVARLLDAGDSAGGRDHLYTLFAPTPGHASEVELF